MLSCSTCWNCTRHTKGDAMIQEILDLGFERVELGHGIRLSLMEGIQRYYEAGKVHFSDTPQFLSVAGRYHEAGARLLPVFIPSRSRTRASG